jgi:polyhydroxybutyrate depolymerase
LTVDGTARRYLLSEPDVEAAGVVLCLHGSMSDATRQASYSRMADLSTTSAAVVAFPQAVAPHGRGFDWDHDRDLPYLAAVVDELRHRHLPEGGGVCMAGMSGGARMASRFAWARADTVSAVGAVAGLRAAPDLAPPVRPVPVIAFDGSADRINPYGGDGSERWGESVPDAARRWAAANHVQAEPSVTTPSATLTCTRWGAPGGTGEVKLYTFSGAGHVWPGGGGSILLRLFLGRPTKERDATAEIWRYATSRRS